jgi:hypothetical protein
MSSLKPDIYPRKKDKQNFFIETPIDKLVEEVSAEPPTVTNVDLKDDIENYARGFNEEERKLYKYLGFSSKIARNVRDSEHYLHLFEVALMASLRHTFPEKDLDELENSFKNVKSALAKVVKDGNVPNTIYIQCLLGMVRGLI